MGTFYSDLTALVTGAASGLGRALAQRLAADGCHVALCDLKETDLISLGEELRTKYPDIRVSTHLSNIGQKASMMEMRQEVLKIHGGINFLFNNAGVTLCDSVRDGHFADFEHVVNVNLMGAVFGTKIFLKDLESQETAHIINISSMFGAVAYPNHTAYCTSKFGLRGFSESLSIELRHSHVHVHCVLPGFIRTSLLDNGKLIDVSAIIDTIEEFKEGFDRFGILSASQAANKILSQVARKKSQIIIGADGKCLSIVQRIFPSFYKKIFGYGIDVYSNWSRQRKS